MNGKIIGIGVASFLGVLVFAFAMESIGVMKTSFFGKWREEVRREIFTESTAYRQGMQLNLSNMLNDYNAADSTGKAGIIAAVRHQYSQIPKSNMDEMPAYLQTFLRTAGVY